MKDKNNRLVLNFSKIQNRAKCGPVKVHALQVVNLILFDSNSFPNFYQFKINSETYFLKYLQGIQMSTTKRQNIAGGCKQELTLETEN